MSDTSVLGLIMDKVNSDLVMNLQTLVDSTDLTRAGIVRPGLLQDDPTKFKVSVLSFSNDIDDDGKWHHSVVEYDISDSKANPAGYQIGGGSMWWRRFTTEIEMYWKNNTDRQVARTFGGVVLSRAEESIRGTSMNHIVDSFKEYALQIYLVRSRLSDGGGQSQFITHAKLWWQVLTSKD